MMKNFIAGMLVVAIATPALSAPVKTAVQTRINEVSAKAKTEVADKIGSVETAYKSNANISALLIKEFGIERNLTEPVRSSLKVVGGKLTQESITLLENFKKLQLFREILKDTSAADQDVNNKLLSELPKFILMMNREESSVIRSEITLANGQKVTLNAEQVSVLVKAGKNLVENLEALAKMDSDKKAIYLELLTEFNKLASSGEHSAKAMLMALSKLKPDLSLAELIELARKLGLCK